MKENIKNIMIIVIITIMCKAMLINMVAYDVIMIIATIISNINFFIFTKNIYNFTKREKVIKYVIYTIIIVVNFIVLPYIADAFVYYIAAVVLRIVNKKNLFDNDRKFVIINISLFFVLGIILHMSTLEIQYKLANSVIFFNVFSIANIVIFTYVIASKITITNEKNLYLISIIAIAMVLIINIPKLYEINKILNKEKEMISILEQRMYNISTKKQMELLVEDVIGKQEIKQEYVEQGYFLTDKACENLHNAILCLFDSIRTYMKENKGANIIEMKKNINKDYKMLLEMYKFIELIKKEIQISTILNIICIAIYALHRNRKGVVKPNTISG